MLIPHNSKPDKIENTKHSLLGPCDREWHSKRNSWQTLLTRKHRKLSRSFIVHGVLCVKPVRTHTEHSLVNKKYLGLPRQASHQMLASRTPYQAVPRGRSSSSTGHLHWAPLFAQTLQGSRLANRATQAVSQLAE